MNILLDHLTAAIIGGTILLMLIAGQHRSQRSAVEATTFYAHKQQQLSFAEVMRHDMQGVSRLASIQEHPVDSSFTFFGQVSPTDTTKRQITYRRTRVGVRNGVDLYQVRRFVGGQRAGASPPTITSWMIEAYNEQGGAIQSPADGRQVRVRFELASPLSALEPITSGRWEATFHPPLLKQERTV